MTDYLLKRLSIISFIGVFAIPFLAALLILKTGFWQDLPKSHAGKMIDPPVSFTDLVMPTSAPTAPTWKIIYLLPEACLESCQAHLWQLKQIHTALGVDRSRVSRWMIQTPNTSNVAAHTQKDLELSVIAGNTQKITSLLIHQFPKDLSEGSQGKILIADPLGNIVLGYSTQLNDEAHILAQGKAILTDIRKLLKLSRIG
jgi:hypothetical protein